MGPDIYLHLQHDFKLTCDILWIRADRNATQSPLLMLPVEVRGIILRMVVGDKTYHLHKSILTVLILRLRL